MSTTATIILMGLIVVGIGALASFLPLSEEEKAKLDRVKSTTWSDAD